MATGRIFKLFEDINLNVANKNINIMKGYSRAPDLESNLKNVKFQETSKNLSNFFLSVRGQLNNMLLSYFGF